MVLFLVVTWRTFVISFYWRLSYYNSFKLNKLPREPVYEGGVTIKIRIALKCQ